jgi:peptidoglycan/LPS O-acetylase OafA/YrhL
MAGAMLAVVKVFRPRWWWWMMQRPLWFLAPGLAGIYAAMGLTSPGYAGAVFGFPLLSLGLALILVAAASRRTWLGRTRVPGVAQLASMAFSLYLTHKAVYHLVRPYLGGVLAHAALTALAI